MARPYTWTAEDEACWQRFTKGVPNYGTDERNATRLPPARASDVFAMLRDMTFNAAPWVITLGCAAFALTHI